MTDEEITILIESYLDGELSEQERLQFEQELKTNKELANDLLIHQEIRNALGDEDLIDLREKLSIIREDYHRKEKKKKRFAIFASSSIIVIAFITTFFICNKSYTNDELYNMYYEHYDAGTIVRGEVQPTKEIYTNALRTYDKGQYAEAIKLFEQIRDTSAFYQPKEYYTALSYMELQNFDKALNHLEPLLKNNVSALHKNIIWFSGLCYLKTNQNEKAKQQFKYLSNSSSCFKQKSTEILEKI